MNIHAAFSSMIGFGAEEEKPRYPSAAAPLILRRFSDNWFGDDLDAGRYR
jgi:hypothetical protein